MSLYDLFIYFLCPIFGYVECHTATGNEERTMTMTVMLMGCGGGDALLDGDQDHNHLRDVVRGLEREGEGRKSKQKPT